jgi:cytochrome b involved in lipid metabolism
VRGGIARLAEENGDGRSDGEDDVDDAYVEGSEEVAVIRGFVFDVAAYIREQTVSTTEEGQDDVGAAAGISDDGSIVAWKDVEPRVYTAKERATIEKEVSVNSNASQNITNCNRPCYSPYIHLHMHMHAITNGKRHISSHYHVFSE